MARGLLKYWVDNSDATLVPPWDFKDSELETNPSTVVKDTSAAAIVVEQLARLAIRPNLDAAAQQIVEKHLGPMIDGLLKFLVPTGGRDGRSAGVLLGGCFNHPKSDATHSELIWGLRTYFLPCTT